MSARLPARTGRDDRCTRGHGTSAADWKVVRTVSVGWGLQPPQRGHLRSPLASSSLQQQQQQPQREPVSSCGLVSLQSCVPFIYPWSSSLAYKSAMSGENLMWELATRSIFQWVLYVALARVPLARVGCSRALCTPR